MYARPFGVVGIGPARCQIGLVRDQCAITRDRRTVATTVVTARQLLRLILRLVERQHVLAVSILEVVSQREGLSPVCAAPVAHLQHPRAIGLVAPIHQQDAACQRRTAEWPAADF